ncbi:hypothetical protein [Microbacterium candidum]|uniref:Head decoration protein n=1 Tax=Microbacterium candidum TaxID=3041922 RepID=A0ABT7MWM0_9MICO|nr:hypothetical protein [Microbacterium sp. ASV49]MDL9978848.1 hypothetical protein [Microbacterium sp. ASV49]
MAAIAVKPYVFKNCVLNIKDGATDLGTFEAAVSSAVLTPSVSVVTWQGGIPASVFQDTTTPVWVFDLKHAQDWETAGSLSNVLAANAGKALTFALTGNGSAAAPKKATFTAICVPGPYGADVGSVAEAAVSMPVTVAPVFA